MKRRTIVSLSAILALVAGATPAAGTVVTIAFSGTIDFVEDVLPFSDSIDAGTPFEGAYSYDSDRPDNSPNDPTGGGYSFPDFNMSFNIGELAFATPDLGITVWNFTLFDTYDVTNITPFSAHGVDWGLAMITLRDDTGTAHSSDALPVSAPVLADFNFARTFLLRKTDQRDPSVTGTITSMALIPEPSALALFAVGGMLVLRHSRAQRSGR